MAGNDFKQSTGYYTLNGISLNSIRLLSVLIVVLVFRVSGLRPGSNNIYVKVKVRDIIQRTDIIRDSSESWNECLPM